MAPLNDTQKRYLELMRQAAQTGGYRSRNEQETPEEDRSWLMTGLDYIGRPYSALTGLIVGMQRPEINAGEAFLRGLTGEQYYSGADIVGNVVDPYQEGRNEAAKRWGGLGWDLTIGGVYDPLSYLTFGSSKGAKALQKAKSALDKPWAEGALKGLTQWPGRTEAAKRGASAWSLLRAQGRVPFTKIGMDIPLTPKAINVPAAKALDYAGKTIGESRAYQNLRRVVGGWRYIVDKEYPGLSSFIAERRLWDKESYKQVADELVDIAEKYPEQARIVATHLSEMPELANSSGKVMLRIPEHPTLDDYKRFAEEIRPYVEAPVTATKMHQHRMLQEIKALRDSIKNWHEGAAGYDFIDVEDIEAKFVNVLDADEALPPGAYLEELLNPSGPGGGVENVIKAYLVDEGVLPHDFEGMPEFVGIFDRRELAELRGKYHRPKEKIRVPMTKRVPVKDANGNMIPGPNGKPQYHEVPVLDASGQPKMRVKTKGGKAEYMQKLKRIAQQRRVKGEEFRYGVEMAESLTHGETGSYAILYRRPGYSNLRPDLQGVGGLAPLNVRQKRVLETLDAVDQWVSEGGNSLRLSEALVAKDEDAIKQVIKQAGLKDNKTTRAVLEAAHYNIWAGQTFPGRFGEHAKMLADELLGEVTLEPHQRYAHTQAKLKQLKQELLEEQDKILGGDWDPPRDVLPDADEALRADMPPKEAAPKDPWEMTRAEWEQQFPAAEPPESFQGSAVPETLYHGSHSPDISDFITDPSDLGRNTGVPSAKLGAFFSDDPDVALHFGWEGGELGILESPQTMHEVKVNLRNPLKLDNLTKKQISELDQAFPGFAKKYKKLGNSEDKGELLLKFAEARRPRQGTPSFREWALERGLDPNSADDSPAFQEWLRESRETVAKDMRSEGQDWLRVMGYDGIIVNTSYGKEYVVFDPADIFITRKKPVTSHDVYVKVASQEGHPVPRRVLEEYAGEPWADDALAELGDIGDEDIPDWLEQAGRDESVIEQTGREGAYLSDAYEPLVPDDVYDEAAPVMQNTRLEEIQAEIEVIEEAMAEANPFDKAMFVKKMLEGKTRPSVGVTFRVEEVTSKTLGVSDAARAAWARGQKILDDTLDEMMRRVRQVDPKAKPSIQHYVPHSLKKSRSPIEGLKRKRATGKAVDDFLQKRRTYWTTQGLTDADLIEDIANREMREEFGLNAPGMAKKTGRGHDDHFLFRKHKSTLLELEYAGFKVPFEKDFPAVVNDAVRTRMNWCYGYDLYDFAAKKFGKHVDELTPELIQLQRLVPIDYYVPFTDAGKNPFKSVYIPKDLDNVLQGMLHLQHELTSDAAFKGILDSVGAVRRWWSAWTLLPFPAFHARNLGSDMLLAAQADAKPWTSTGRLSFPAAADAVFGELPLAKKATQGRLQKYMEALNKQFPDISKDDLLRIMRREEILEGGMRDVDLLMQGAQLETKTGTRLQRAAREFQAWMPLHPDIKQSKLLAKTGRAGQHVQDSVRAACFMDLLLQNSKIPGLKWEDALDDAIKVTRKTLFDYHDLTATERHLLKNLIPFYTFTAKNLPRQLEVLFTEPKRFAYLARAYSGMWNTDDEIFERDMLPDWLKNAMGVPIRRKTVGDHEEWVVWSPTGWIPMTEINELAEMFRSPFAKEGRQFEEAGKFWLSRLNPMFKEPVEQLMNYDNFMGRKIDNGEVRDIFGISVNPRIAHGIRNIRFVTEIDRLNPGGLFTKLGQIRGHWKEERPHRREAPGLYRGMRALTGMSVYDQKPLQEMRNAFIRLKIEGNKLRREAERSMGRGHVHEAQKLMGLVKEKQQGLVRLSDMIERHKQGRARMVEEREK